MYLVGCWSSVSIRRIIYKFVNVCLFLYFTSLAVSEKVGTDRPKSVRNRCVIEVFVSFVLSLYFCEFSVGIGDSVIGLSHISYFFSSFCVRYLLCIFEYYGRL